MSIVVDRDARSPHDLLAAEVELIQGSTRQLLLTLLSLDDAALAEPSVTRLGTRRHVVARLVRHADRRLAAIEGTPEPIADDALLRVTHAELLDRVTGSLGAVIASLSAHPAGAAPQASLDAAREHLAWLELSHVDLGAGRTIDAIPDAALDAVATHFQADRHSPFAALVAH
ncbi:MULTISPECIES: hypothetical protein [unclassified Agrococcus]|uniref:hypothetical protein n=1 Tax=unclassified Agrococcus TaxID=2615065 RepID=UPI003614F8C7